MLRHTFQMIPGIGQARERELWASGITAWSQFPLPLLSQRPHWLSGAHEARLTEAIGRMKQGLAERDLPPLIRSLPSRERWRLHRELLPVSVFFDIETDGSREAAPTVVSLLHGKAIELFVAGRNMDELPEALGRWPVWISFGGVRCDEPWLRAAFPQLARPAFHFDLCPFARALGFKGGLKALEEHLGLIRPETVRGMNGRDAVFLWRRWRERGDKNALKRLCEYNIYDTIQLRPLAASLFNMAIDRIGREAGAQDFTNSVPRLQLIKSETLRPRIDELLAGLSCPSPQRPLPKSLSSRSASMQSGLT